MLEIYTPSIFLANLLLNDDNVVISVGHVQYIGSETQTHSKADSKYLKKARVKIL
jgi:hypothetical protein